MIDPAIPHAHPAWRSLRISLRRWLSLLAERGLRLLAVELIIALIGVLPSLAWLLTGVIPYMTAVAVAWVVSAIGGAFLTAWAWSAALAILSQVPSDDSPRVTVGHALRVGLRGVGLRGVRRLWGWLVLLQAFSLPSLLIYLDIDLAVAYSRPPLSTLFQGLSWYVAFATALLPIAILIERRGIGRALLLTHSKLSTVAGVVTLNALAWTADRLMDGLSSRVVEALSSMAIGIPLSVVVTSGYYVIYLAHIEATSGAE